MIKSASRSSITNDQKYRSMLAGTVPSSEYLIETALVSTATPSVTFSNLAQYAGIYKHLQICYVMRSDRGGVPYTNGALRLNGDTASNYNAHYLGGDGSTVFSGFVSTNTSMLIGSQVGGTFTANGFSAGVMDLLDVFSATKFTTVRSFSGQVGNFNGVSLQSGLYRVTDAVSSVTILNWDGANLDTGSRFSLYGVV